MMPFPDAPYTLIYLEETDSTSNYLQALSNGSRPDEFTTVVTGFQTSGKGQRGNSWESERGRNLLFSFVLYPQFLAANKQFMISKIIAISIKESLDEYSEGFTIKWPNDIYWHDKKICGTLIENDLQGSKLARSIAGIGINVNQETFYSPAPNPVSLKQITGSEHDTDRLLKSIMNNVIRNYAMLQKGQFEEIDYIYHQSLYRKEGFHPYVDSNGRFEATITEVLPEGFLILETREGEKRSYAFKEVQYL